jgi:Ser/Thr protein kinase RdoA (MazF antagonist)
LRPETSDVEAEGERLCGLIARHHHDLLAASLGTQFQLENVSVALVSKGRNTVYRLSARLQWFLKLTDKSQPLVHERLGAEFAVPALTRHPEYAGASLIRVSMQPGYVLSSAISGRPLNKVFFTSSWVPGPGMRTRLQNDFCLLGRLAATLHVAGAVDRATPQATTRPFEIVSKLLERTKRPNAVVDAIAHWEGARRREDAGDELIHGNLRMDNVLHVEGRLGFIDFENCGRGSFYQDLSRPVSQLLLTRALMAFPQGRATGCIRAFVKAYSEMNPYDSDVLWDYVRARQARHYLEAREKGWLDDRVGGIPVLRGVLERLTLSVLQDPYEDVLPEIGISG